MSGHGGPIVFVGPSLDRAVVAEVLPAATVHPPIARGDLTRLREDGATSFLIIDGVFAHRLAVAPSEIVDAIAAGVQVVGAASIGAIRAAECWPAGMEGVGAVHRLYRLGVLRDDDEVAVAINPGRGFAALSVSLVNIRYALLRALRTGLLDRRRAEALLTAAQSQHFTQRRWETIFAAAEVEPSVALTALCAATDVKRDDAVRAIEKLARCPRPAVPPSTCGQRPIGATGRVAGARRYSGHDPFFGHSPAELRRVLVSWLHDSGRHRRYFRDSLPDGGDRQAREAGVWRELEAQGALAHELMLWYASQQV